MSVVLTIASWIGISIALGYAIYLLAQIYGYIYACWAYCCRVEYDLISRYGRCWVLITGATNVIGVSYCKAFAIRGFNILMVGSNQSRLDLLAKLISTEFGVETKTLVANFAQANNTGFYEELVQRIGDLDVGIIVNNASVAQSLFEKSSPSDIVDVVVINTYPATLLTKLLIPKLKSRVKRSAVINISSVGGDTPLSGFPVYSATKAYERFLAIALSQEYKDKIDFLAMKPGVLETDSNDFVKGDHWYKLKPDQSAHACIQQLGAEVETWGHWRHGLYGYSATVLPGFLTRALSLDYAEQFYKENMRIHAAANAIAEAVVQSSGINLSSKMSENTNMV